MLTADGTPVRAAAVTLTNAHGEVVAGIRSGHEGGYEITVLIAGEYTLSVVGPPSGRAPAFRPAGRAARHRAGVPGGPPGHRARSRRGAARHLRTGGGRPVDDARVTLRDAAGRAVDT